jgi:hypothetical protein
VIRTRATLPRPFAFASVSASSSLAVIGSWP